MWNGRSSDGGHFRKALFRKARNLGGRILVQLMDRSKSTAATAIRVLLLLNYEFTICTESLSQAKAVDMRKANTHSYTHDVSRAGGRNPAVHVSAKTSGAPTQLRNPG